MYFETLCVWQSSDHRSLSAISPNTDLEITMFAIKHLIVMTSYGEYKVMGQPREIIDWLIKIEQEHGVSRLERYFFWELYINSIAIKLKSLSETLYLAFQYITDTMVEKPWWNTSKLQIWTQHSRTWFQGVWFCFRLLKVANPVLKWTLL